MISEYTGMQLWYPGGGLNVSIAKMRTPPTRENCIEAHKLTGRYKALCHDYYQISLIQKSMMFGVQVGDRFEMVKCVEEVTSNTFSITKVQIFKLL